MDYVYYIERKSWEPRHPPLYIKPLYRSHDGRTGFDLLSPGLVWEPVPGLEEERAAGTIELRRLKDKEARAILRSLHPGIDRKKVAVAVPFEHQGWSGIVICPKCGGKAKSDYLSPKDIDPTYEDRSPDRTYFGLALLSLFFAPFTPYKCPACGPIRYRDLVPGIRVWMVVRGFLVAAGLVGIVMGILVLLLGQASGVLH